MVDTVESAADWCCEHWKLIVTIVIVVVAVALLWTGVGGVLLAGACWGALSGAVIGGVSGGLTSMANGGSFLEGFEDGAFSGALAGAICGAAFAGLGQLGAVCGKSIKCISPFGKAIRGTAAVTTAISIAMGSFDTLALADLAFGSGTIYDLNSKLHSNTAYNIFQTGVTALAVFTGGMTGTMKCFIAGTLIAIETGFAGIESIKPGDLVLSTNADTMESGYKKVLEKYVRKTRELVHIIAGGEEIVSTPGHPYYVAGRGFVNACQLCIGSPLLDADGRVLETEQIYKESLEEDEEVTVYNFQVEEWHTYHVGEMEVLVHNAEYESGSASGKVWDYSKQFDGELANFNVGYEIKNVIEEDLYLVQFHSNVEVGSGRSLKYWTTFDAANGIRTVDDYMNQMALLSNWGARDNVSIAKIPAETKIKYAIGTAKEQVGAIKSRPGGGLQILFEKFDDGWVLDTKSLP